MPATKQFKINRAAFSRHYTVLPSAPAPSSTPLYYVDQSLFTRDKANLTLHACASADGPVVAVAHLPRFSFDCKIGLGDPSSSPADVIWEDLVRSSRDSSAHRFSLAVTIPGSEDDEPQEDDRRRRRTFVWKRTHKVTAEGVSKNTLTMRDLKLVEVVRREGQGDEEEGEEVVVGVFTAQRGWSSCGVLQFDVDYGEQFELMATASMLAIYEKARKRRARAGAGGGGS